VNLAEFGVRKHVAVNLIMLALIGAGIGLGLTLRREFFPDVTPSLVTVSAPYPGAQPDEIEDSLAIKIEDRVADLEGVDEINTTVIEGSASVMIEFEDGIDLDTALARVKREVDALQDLPEQSERIVVAEFVPNIPVCTVTLYGDSDERVMKEALREIQDDLRSVQGMGDLQTAGVRTDEITVAVRPEAMLEHGLSLPVIADRVGQAMRELPGGAVRTGSANVTVRTVAAEERVDEVREIVVRADETGRPLRLGEVAAVSAGFEDVELRTRFNGNRSMSLFVYARPKQDVVTMAGIVKAYVAGRNGEAFEPTFFENMAIGQAESGGGVMPPRAAAHRLGASKSAAPPGTLLVHNDVARFIEQRLSLLSRNALQGGVLVFATLMLLLAPRVAFWVAVGLIVSMLASLAAMSVLDMSLNFLTMFGLIIVIGLLVDDAIVVAENIKAKHEAGASATQAAIEGTREVAWPVISTVLTTICAFLPLTVIEGQIGDLLAAIPIVVSVALAVSLIEALLILPSHMGHSLAAAERARPNVLTPVFSRLERFRVWLFRDVLEPGYVRVMRPTLRARYLTLAVSVCVFLVTVALPLGGRVGFEFFPSADSESVTIDLRMPEGTPMEATDRAIARVERVANGLPEVDALFTLVGARNNVDDGSTIAQSHLAQIYMELKPVEDRDRTSAVVIDEIQREVGEIPGAESLRFTEVGAGPAGADITYTVVGDDEEEIAGAVEELKTALAGYEGVRGIADDSDAGQRELRLRLRDGAKSLGFTVDSVARQVRGAVFGLEAYTFAGDREDVDVRVLMTDPVRKSLAGLESTHLFTPDGRAVPLEEAVAVTEGRSYATVRRLDRQRAVTVTADVDRAVTTSEAVVADLGSRFRSIEAHHPGVKVLPRGTQLEMQDSFRTLPMGMLAAVGLIYVVLAWLFSSYVQPAAVLAAVPFAAVGAIWGHILMGYQLTFLSMIGFVALTGIVVNDSLVFMEFYNHKRAEGLSVFESCAAAGRQRLRAIILTTVTTVLGLTPLMFEQSFQAKFLVPMAITISFGLMSATFIMLIILPCVLLVGDDVKRFFAGKRVVGHDPSDEAIDEAALAARV